MVESGQAAVDPAPPPVAAPTPTRGSDLSWPVFGALLITLVIDTALATAVVVANTRFGHGVVHLLGTAMWIAVAVLNGAAVWNVARRRHRWFVNVALAQAAALVLAGYVLWSAHESSARDPGVRWAALAVAIAAVWWLCILVAKAPTSSAHLFGTSWKVVAASFSLLGLFTLWLQTSYLPSTARPMVDVSTSLTKVDQNADTTVLSATITLHNRGLAAAVVVGSLYRVTSSPVEKLPYTGPIGVDDDAIGDLVADTSHQDDVLGQAFDLTAPNEHDFTGDINVLKADEIIPMREFLLPGQTWSTEAIVRMPSASAHTARLTAQIALITDRYLGDTRACEGGTSNQLDVDFQQQVRQVLAGPASVSETPGGPPSEGQRHFICVQTALEPQSAIQDLVGDHPSIRSYYVLSDDGLDITQVPYLVTTFQSADQPRGTEDAERAAKKIDAKNPSAVIESQAEYGTAGPDR